MMKAQQLVDSLLDAADCVAEAVDRGDEITQPAMMSLLIEVQTNLIALCELHSFSFHDLRACMGLKQTLTARLPQRNLEVEVAAIEAFLGARRVAR